MLSFCFEVIHHCRGAEAESIFFYKFLVLGKFYITPTKKTEQTGFFQVCLFFLWLPPQVHSHTFLRLKSQQIWEVGLVKHRFTFTKHLNKHTLRPHEICPIIQNALKWDFILTIGCWFWLPEPIRILLFWFYLEVHSFIYYFRNIGYVLVYYILVTLDPDIPSDESRKKKRWWNFRTKHWSVASLEDGPKFLVPLHFGPLNSVSKFIQQPIRMLSNSAGIPTLWGARELLLTIYSHFFDGHCYFD